jgi:deoxyadenosine/deoxycytidine kinase
MQKTAPYIAIAGSIAVGKSTLAKNLGRRMGASYILEPYESNPFVSLSYQDPEEWSFRSQMFFLAETARAHQSEIKNSASTVLTERSIYEHFEVFATLHKNSMREDEYMLLEKIYQTIRMLLRPPDLLIYLHLDQKEALKNIQGRNRDFEKEIQRQDLQVIEELYQRFIGNWTLSPIIEWDTKESDLRTKGNLENLLKEIKDRVDVSTVVI